LTLGASPYFALPYAHLSPYQQMTFLVTAVTAWGGLLLVFVVMFWYIKQVDIDLVM